MIILKTVSETGLSFGNRLFLTDDDVFEDVGVVVRCGCHLDTVTGDKQGNSPDLDRTLTRLES